MKHHSPDQRKSPAPVIGIHLLTNGQTVHGNGRVRMNFRRTRPAKALGDVDVDKVPCRQLPDGIAAVDVRHDLQVDVGHRIHVLADLRKFRPPGLVMHGAGENREAVGNHLSQENIPPGLQGDGGKPLGLPVKLPASGHRPVVVDVEIRRVSPHDILSSGLITGSDHDVRLVRVPTHARHIAPAADLHHDHVIHGFERRGQQFADGGRVGAVEDGQHFAVGETGRRATMEGRIHGDGVGAERFVGGFG